MVDKRRRRKEGEEGGRRLERGGRREKEGGGSISDSIKRVLPFQPFALLAASRIMWEALDQEDCGLESSKRFQIDKDSVLEN